MNILFLFILLLTIILFTFKTFNISTKLLIFILAILVIGAICFHFISKENNIINTEQYKLSQCFANPQIDNYVNSDQDKIINDFKNRTKLNKK